LALWKRRNVVYLGSHVDENSGETLETLEKFFNELADFCYLGFKMHPGHPEEYIPLLSLLKDKWKPNEEYLESKCAQSRIKAWSKPTRQTEFNISKDIASKLILSVPNLLKKEKGLSIVEIIVT